MNNSPETLEKRNIKRNTWKEEADLSTVPLTIKRICKDCGELGDCGWNYTFSSTGKPEYRARCISCFKLYSSKIQKRNRTSISLKHKKKNNERKIESIRYLGGKCIACGYDKSMFALTFHHRDRGEKERDVGSMLDWSWDNLKAELDKCDLMCFNCHMELHGEE